MNWWRSAPAVLACALCACGGDPVDPPLSDAGVLPPPALSGLPCAEMEGCAADGPHIAGTCCAQGDNLVALTRGEGSEVVDIESDGRVAILCGGFGATFDDVRDPESPERRGNISRRCQHSSFGADLSDGRQVAYLSHHGDSWVPLPTLTTVLIDPDGTPTAIDQQRDPALLFEGLRYHDGHLYVAAHEDGLLVYSTGADGRPVALTSLTGLGNVSGVEIDPEAKVAYVMDADVGVVGVSIADPNAPAELWRVETTSPPRDMVVDADHLYVALGGFGVDVLDVPAPETEAPTISGHVDTLGSAQAVSVQDGVLAVAAWSHVALYDVRRLSLLATEKTRPRREFEQDLGVAFLNGVVMVGEWEGLHTLRYRPGYVAPDLWIDEDLFAFNPEQRDAHAVIVRNLGPLPLVIDALRTSAPDRLSVDRERFVVDPFGRDVFEILHTPPSDGAPAFLSLRTNDPDDASPEILLVTEQSALLGVGDRLTDEFAFLDPTGARQLNGLEGNITVLSYFALF